MPRAVIIRSPLPGTPEQVFALLTEGAHLARWFCDACDSDAQLGGEVHASWTDEDDEPWDRVGVWVEFDAPYRLTLRWLPVQTAADLANPEAPPADPEAHDELKFAIAPHPMGAMLTVLSPPPQVETQMRWEVLEEATQRGWQQCFQLLEQLLAECQVLPLSI
jgi:uncharacterized protein YndB with AHSA1/START domain